MEIVTWIMWIAFRPYVYEFGLPVLTALAVAAAAGAVYGLMAEPTPQRA